MFLLMDYKVNESLIGERIRAARESKNISQVELSRITGIQNSAISAFENGHRTPGLQNLAIIAMALDVTIDELYFGDRDVYYTEHTSDKGMKIANCIRGLTEEKVLRLLLSGATGEYRNVVQLSKYSKPIIRLISTLEQFFRSADTYSDPKGFSAQIVESAAREINRMSDD